MAPATEPATSPGSLRGFCLSVLQNNDRLYLRPLGLLTQSDAAGVALPLAGGPMGFTHLELAVRSGDRIERTVAPVADVIALDLDPISESLHRLTAPRAAFAGLPMDRPAIMGVVNITPDSFSDGGDFFDPAAAIAHGAALLDAGADILDIGGESTRPNADPVTSEEEIRRVVPVIRHFAARGARVSIDTRHAAVMAVALAAGAAHVNDISGLTGDPDSAAVVARAGAPVVLMHMQGDPRTMQQAPHYVDAPLDVYDWLAARLAACRAAGMPEEKLCVDPGIGFGKTVDHNLSLLRHTALFHGLGMPLLIGVSRKSFIGALSRKEPPKQRLAGSLAAGLAALDQGAQILRVHDVAETFQVLAMWQALHGTHRA
jgi:dihydropteroate synthase